MRYSFHLIVATIFCFWIGQICFAQYSYEDDPEGDVPGYPSWIDITKTDVSANGSNILVFGMDLAGAVPEEPYSNVGYVWGIDADKTWSEPVGFWRNDIETEYHVRLTYDSGQSPPWFAVIDQMWPGGSAVPADGHSFVDSRKRVEVFVDIDDLGSISTFYWVSWIAWPGSIPEEAPNSGHGEFWLNRSDFIRGDSEADMDVEMSDAIEILKYLYIPGHPDPSCMDAADANDSGVVDASDAIYLLRSLYVPGAPEPPPPFPDCGDDPTSDGLGCSLHPCGG